MEEQKVENFGVEENPMPIGEAIPAQMAPAPEPTPIIPVEPAQPMSVAPSPAPEVERIQVPIQPIDFSGQQNASTQPAGITMQMEAPKAGGNKKVLIIGGVVITLLVVSGGAFFAWKSMNQPVVETPVATQPAAPIALPTSTEMVAVPVVPEPDDVSTIEQSLNAFNMGGLDAEVETSLNELNKAL